MNTRVTPFTESEIKQLHDAYDGFKTVPAERVLELRSVFERCSTDALIQIALARIKFISAIAVNTCTRRGIDIVAHHKPGAV